MATRLIEGDDKTRSVNRRIVLSKLGGVLLSQRTPEVASIIEGDPLSAFPIVPIFPIFWMSVDQCRDSGVDPETPA